MSDSEDDVPLAVRARQMAAGAVNGTARKAAGAPSGLLASRERAQQAQKARAKLLKR